MIHITGTNVVQLPPAAGIKITVNGSLTGTVTLTDAFGVVQAVITNPTVGNNFTYYGVPSNGQNGGSLQASAAGDITVSMLSRTMT